MAVPMMPLTIEQDRSLHRCKECLAGGHERREWAGWLRREWVLFYSVPSAPRLRAITKRYS